MALCAAVLSVGHVAPVAARATSEFAVPTAIPEGWFVLGARAPRTPPGAGIPYYARDAKSGPALSVTSISCDGGCDQLAGSEERAVAGLGPYGGSLVRNGTWVWVAWTSEDNNDVRNVVAARGLTNREVIAAARAARTDPRNNGAAVAVGRRGLPRGFRELGKFPVGASGVPFDAQHVTLVSTDGTSTIDQYVFSAGAAERAAQHFWFDQLPLLSGRHETSVRVESIGRVVVTTGDASKALLTQLGTSVKPIDATQWEAFRQRVAEIPLTALLPGLESVGDYVAIEGTTEGNRWAAVFATSGNVYTAVADIDAGMISKGSGTLDSDRVPAAIRTTATNLLGRGLMASGVAPVAAASIRFEPPGGLPVEGVLASGGPDAEHRYFAAWVPGAGMLVPVVARDADGNEIARREQFGCFTCP
jgi:hypothetical protein